MTHICTFGLKVYLGRRGADAYNAGGGLYTFNNGP